MVVEFVGQAENKIEMRNRGFDGLFGHGHHAVGHAQANVVGDRQVRTRTGVEAGEKLFDRRRGGKAYVAPDSDKKQ